MKNYLALIVLVLILVFAGSACEEAPKTISDTGGDELSETQQEVTQQKIIEEKNELAEQKSADDSFVVEGSYFNLSFPARWEGVQIASDFAGFCPDEDEPVYKLPGRAFTILFPDKNGNWTEDASSMFVITSIDKADKKDSCIPKDAKYIGEDGTFAYFVQKMTPTSPEKKALVEDIDGIVETIKFLDL